MKDLKRNGMMLYDSPDGLSGAFKVEGHFVVDEPNNKNFVDCPFESLSVVCHIRNVMGGLKEADDREYQLLGCIIPNQKFIIK